MRRVTSRRRQQRCPGMLIFRCPRLTRRRRRGSSGSRKRGSRKESAPGQRVFDLAARLVDERPGFLQVVRVEALRERGVDGAKRFHRFASSIRSPGQARQLIAALRARDAASCSRAISRAGRKHPSAAAAARAASVFVPRSARLACPRSSSPLTRTARQRTRVPGWSRPSRCLPRRVPVPRPTVRAGRGRSP